MQRTIDESVELNHSSMFIVPQQSYTLHHLLLLQKSEIKYIDNLPNNPI